MRIRTFMLAAAVGAMSLNSLLADPKPKARFGDLRGQFTYDGEAPERKRINVIKDKDALGDLELFDESLVVHPDNRGIANICVWMYRKRGEEPPPVHPSYDLQEDMEEEIVTRTLTAARGRFTPHVLLLQTSEQLSIKNASRVAYHAKIDVMNNSPNSVVYPPDSKATYRYKKPERLPCPISCNIHPWMRSWIIIQDHPYMAVTDANGRFEIKNVPAGEWTFQFWHEKSGYIRELEIDGKEVEWPRGRATFTISPMPTDLGELKTSPQLFTK